jgi:putative endonuclease
VTARKELGARGETLAAEYLAGQGYRVLSRNYRSALGELDLVAQDGPELVFVEVKTRIGGQHIAPEESVSPSKAARLARLAEAYLSDRKRHDAMWRIDVIAVLLDGTGRLVRLDHLRNAVY